MSARWLSVGPGQSTSVQRVSEVAIAAGAALLGAIGGGVGRYYAQRAIERQKLTREVNLQLVDEVLPAVEHACRTQESALTELAELALRPNEERHYELRMLAVKVGRKGRPKLDALAGAYNEMLASMQLNLKQDILGYQAHDEGAAASHQMAIDAVRAAAADAQRYAEEALRSTWTA